MSDEKTGTSACANHLETDCGVDWCVDTDSALIWYAGTDDLSHCDRGHTSRMKRRWMNPILSARREKRVRQNIDRDLIVYGLAFCKPMNLKPAYTQRLTRIFATITMPTEVQER